MNEVQGVREDWDEGFDHWNGVLASRNAVLGK